MIYDMSDNHLISKSGKELDGEEFLKELKQLFDEYNIEYIRGLYHDDDPEKQMMIGKLPAVPMFCINKMEIKLKDDKTNL